MLLVIIFVYLLFDCTSFVQSFHVCYKLPKRPYQISCNSHHVYQNSFDESYGFAGCFEDYVRPYMNDTRLGSRVCFLPQGDYHWFSLSHDTFHYRESITPWIGSDNQLHYSVGYYKAAGDSFNLLSPTGSPNETISGTVCLRDSCYTAPRAIYYAGADHGPRTENFSLYPTTTVNYKGNFYSFGYTATYFKMASTDISGGSDLGWTSRTRNESTLLWSYGSPTSLDSIAGGSAERQNWAICANLELYTDGADAIRSPDCRFIPSGTLGLFIVMKCNVPCCSLNAPSAIYSHDELLNCYLLFDPGTLDFSTTFMVKYSSGRYRYAVSANISGNPILKYEPWAENTGILDVEVFYSTDKNAVKYPKSFHTGHAYSAIYKYYPYDYDEGFHNSLARVSHSVYQEYIEDCFQDPVYKLAGYYYPCWPSYAFHGLTDKKIKFSSCRHYYGYRYKCILDQDFIHYRIVCDGIRCPPRLFKFYLGFSSRKLYLSDEFSMTDSFYTMYNYAYGKQLGATKLVTQIGPGIAVLGLLLLAWILMLLVFAIAALYSILELCTIKYAAERKFESIYLASTLFVAMFLSLTYMRYGGYKTIIGMKDFEVAYQGRIALKNFKSKWIVLSFLAVLLFPIYCFILLCIGLTLLSQLLGKKLYKPDHNDSQALINRRGAEFEKINKSFKEQNLVRRNAKLHDSISKPKTLNVENKHKHKSGFNIFKDEKS